MEKIESNWMKKDLEDIKFEIAKYISRKERFIGHILNEQEECIELAEKILKSNNKKELDKNELLHTVKMIYAKLWRCHNTCKMYRPKPEDKVFNGL